MTEREASVWVYSSAIVAETRWVIDLAADGCFQTKLQNASRCMISVVETKRKRKLKAKKKDGMEENRRQ